MWRKVECAITATQSKLPLQETTSRNQKPDGGHVPHTYTDNTTRAYTHTHANTYCIALHHPFRRHNQDEGGLWRLVVGDTITKWALPTTAADLVKVLRGYFARVDTDDRGEEGDMWATAAQR